VSIRTRFCYHASSHVSLAFTAGVRSRKSSNKSRALRVERKVAMTTTDRTLENESNEVVGTTRIKGIADCNYVNPERNRLLEV
jgi:hypothetical protein